MKTNSLEAKVRYILENYPKTRDSDITLTKYLWYVYHKESLLEQGDKWYVNMDDLHELPREDNIKRIRARIQNEEKKFLPTSEAVAKKRKWNEHEWRQALGYSY